MALSSVSALAAPATIAERGVGAGQVERPTGVAVDQSTHTVFVADESNHRIDEFEESTGHFIRAFGFGVVNGARELQVCTTVTGCANGLNPATNGVGIRPVNLAVEESTGDVYAYDYELHRVERFSSEGQFLLMFGKGVDQGPHHPGDLCTAEDIAGGDKCGAGSSGAGAGELGLGAAPLALDASGNVWVGDVNRVERFNAKGEYVSQVALPAASGEVQSLAVDGAGDFYTLRRPVDEEQQITPPAAGEYTLTFEGQTTAPIPAGAGGEAIQKALEALSTIGPHNVGGSLPGAGVPRVTFIGALGGKDVEQLTVSGGSPSAVVTTRQGVSPLLAKRSPTGEVLKTFDASGSPNALAFDPEGSGVLYVSDQSGLDGVFQGAATLLSYDASTGAQTEAFGAGEVIGNPTDNALAFGDAAKALFVAGGEVLQSFPEPAAGPLLTFASSRASAVGKTNATLDATINSEGAATTYRFQYITQAQFSADGESFGAGTVETLESSSIGEDFQAHAVSHAISGLIPATAYRFRVVAVNSNAPFGIDGETAGFQTLPPAAIDSTSVADVTSTAAMLQAEINPLADATTYRFEYLTEEAFKADGESFAGPDLPILVPQPDAAIGSGSEDVAVAQPVGALAPDTAYRYRVVVRNAVSEANGGSFPGPVRAFTTQAAGGPLALADNRRWEMVSPPDKHGALLQPIGVEQITQAAAAGGALTYLANVPTEAEPAGYADLAQILSSRAGGGGWVSKDIAPPREKATGATEGGEYRFFSPDLSLGVLQPNGPFALQVSPEASEQTAYLRSDFPPADPAAFCAASCYRPLVTGAEGFANVPPGTHFGERGGPEFVGATPDLSHVVLYSTVALTETPGDHGGLYEWTAAKPPAQQLQLLSILPGGTPAPAASGPALGGHGQSTSIVRNAVSTDGSRAIWSEGAGADHLYLRDVSVPQTVQLDMVQAGASGAGVAAPFYQAASSDASKVFFTDNQRLTADSGGSEKTTDLYECDIVEAGGVLHCDLTDLTPAGSGKPAEALGVAIGASADGSSVYFVANGALENTGAVRGTCKSASLEESEQQACNLYVRHDGATKLVAVLSGADRPDWSGGGLSGLAGLTAGVSPDGRYLAFMSQRPLTGYDNRDARTGAPDEEVFLYDAVTGRTVCASCNPTGARPLGIEYGELTLTTSLDGATDWQSQQMLAASLPGWTSYHNAFAFHQPRYLSDSGRLFFNSTDALVPQDTNGTGDVYQYEPPQTAEEAPPGDTCTTASRTYSPASAGCTSLISSGTSAEVSGFLDASENGDDVFFFTNAQLSPQDFDTARDVYDAHVCSAESSCPPPAPAPAPACEGDACQSPAVAPNDPTPGSLTFQGPGNPAPVLAVTVKKATNKTVKCKKPKKLSHGKCVKNKKKAKKATRASNNRRAKR
jgi:hypothetical protein